MVFPIFIIHKEGQDKCIQVYMRRWYTEKLKARRIFYDIRTSACGIIIFYDIRASAAYILLYTDRRIHVFYDIRASAAYILRYTDKCMRRILYDIRTIAAYILRYTGKCGVYSTIYGQVRAAYILRYTDKSVYFLILCGLSYKNTCFVVQIPSRYLNTKPRNIP